MNNKNVTITIPADYRYIPSVRAFALSFLKEAGVSQKNAYRTEVIIGELCANIVEHTKDENSYITIELKPQNDELQLICTHYTHTLNVTAQDLSDKFNNTVLQPGSMRGRGLFILRSWARNVAFEDIDGGIRISVVQSY